MRRISNLIHRLDVQHKANGVSISVAVFTILFLHLESSPTPAGADISRRPTNRQTFVISAKPDAAAATKAADVSDSDLTPEQRHEKQLLAKIELIEKGLKFLEKTPDYTAQFIRQELVNGELLDETEMEMKVRHQPMSIYLKWVTGEAGREVLFVEGQNDGRLIAHAGGWKAKLPSIMLEPTSGMAMAESRYPIQKAGLLMLAKMMLDVHKIDLQTKRVARCEKLADQMFDDRPCHVFLVEYKDRKTSDQYRKSIALIDKEWSIPVYTRNYGWLTGEAPEDPDQHDAASLVEFYSYSNVKFRPNLIALDFDHTNEEYRFKRQ